MHVQLASSEEVQAYLSNTDGDSIKALIHLDQADLHSPDEKELYELLNRIEEERANGLGRSATPIPDDVLDSISADLASKNSDSDLRLAENSGAATGDGKDDVDEDLGIEFFGPYSKPIIVMAVSCAIALLVVSCAAVVLYIAEIMKKSIFRSTWNILPQLEKTFVSHGTQGGSREVKHVEKRSLCSANEGDSFDPHPWSEKVPMPGAFVLIKTPPAISDHPIRLLLPWTSSRSTSLSDAENDESDSGEEPDEKFFDAESADSDASPHGLSRPTSAPTQIPPPPGLPALAAEAATVTAVAVARSPNMREVESTPISTPISGTRPSWSVRAQEASALVHAQDSNEHRRKHGRGIATAPGLDAALAMQLRPGLGIGADAAWLVRFVMALFGWCAVLMSGRGWRR